MDRPSKPDLKVVEMPRSNLLDIPAQLHKAADRMAEEKRARTVVMVEYDGDGCSAVYAWGEQADVVSTIGILALAQAGLCEPIDMPPGRDSG